MDYAKPIRRRSVLRLRLEKKKKGPIWQIESSGLDSIESAEWVLSIGWVGGLSRVFLEVEAGSICGGDLFRKVGR